MKRESIFTSVLLLVFFAVSFSQPGPRVKAGLSPQEVEAEPGGFFTLKLVILEGGSFVRAGEFNLSYTTDSLELLNVTPVNEWVILETQKAYVFYTLKTQLNETTIAELKFRYKLDAPASVTLIYLVAADAKGNDLQVLLEPNTARVSTRRATPYSIVKRESGLPFTWIVVLVLSTLAVVAAALAVQQLKKTATAYSLIDRSGRVVFRTTSKDRVYGREDFAGFLAPDKLAYITRRSKGGQFRIVKGRDGWYIIDAYSTNPTLVNGIPIKGRGYVKLNNGASISVQGAFDLYFRVSGSA
ncbi:MAG: FHA domain-containing protein [Thermofilaceae archaeon]